MNHSTNHAVPRGPVDPPGSGPLLLAPPGLVCLDLPAGNRHGGRSGAGRLLVARAVTDTAVLVAVAVAWSALDIPPAPDHAPAPDAAPDVPTGAPRTRLGDAPGTAGTRYRGVRR